MNHVPRVAVACVVLLSVFMSACVDVRADTKTGSATAPAPSPSHPVSAVAPADEYFGHMKMSVLGIQNVIRDMRLRVEADATQTPTIFDKKGLCLLLRLAHCCPKRDEHTLYSSLISNSPLGPLWVFVTVLVPARTFLEDKLNRSLSIGECVGDHPQT